MEKYHLRAEQQHLYMLVIHIAKRSLMAWVDVIPKEGCPSFFSYDTDFLDFLELGFFAKLY